jgi:hypothetical protein
MPDSQDKTFDEHNIGIRDNPLFAAERRNLSHRNNFGGAVSIVRQMVSRAQRGRAGQGRARQGRVLPEMRVKIMVAGAEICIGTYLLDQIGHDENLDWK